jgi:Flp pilus assembly protein TadD
LVRGLEVRARSLLDRGEVETAAQLLRQTIMQETRANPRHLNLLGICEIRLGHRETAREIFSSVLSEFPRNAAALTNLGNVAFLNDDQKAARDYYARALQENVLLQEPRYNLVRSYQHMGHFEKALRAYEEYVAVANASRWSKTTLFLFLILLAVFLIARR